MKTFNFESVKLVNRNYDYLQRTKYSKKLSRRIKNLFSQLRKDHDNYIKEVDLDIDRDLELELKEKELQSVEG